MSPRRKYVKFHLSLFLAYCYYCLLFVFNCSNIHRMLAQSIAEESAFEEQEDEQLALVGATSAGPRQRTLGAGGDGPDRSASTSRLRTVSTNEDAALSKKGHSLSDATILSTQDAAAGVGELSGEVEEDEDDKDGGGKFYSLVAGIKSSSMIICTV